MAMNLSTRELAAFVTLAEQRSFTARGTEPPAQPALSALIRTSKTTSARACSTARRAASS
jgi:hypothetical protein